MFHYVSYKGDLEDGRTYRGSTKVRPEEGAGTVGRNVARRERGKRLALRETTQNAQIRVTFQDSERAAYLEEMKLLWLVLEQVTRARFSFALISRFLTSDLTSMSKDLAEILNEAGFSSSTTWKVVTGSNV